MKREILITGDGSTTIHLPEWNESYHSKHGAIQEAYHVFIRNGLDLAASDAVSILEMGFGTGLNAFITFLESERKGQCIEYVGVDAYPVTADEAKRMNYATGLAATQFENEFSEMHGCEWEKEHTISKNFTLTKRRQLFDDIDYRALFDLIYFDAFGYRVQPELWRTEIFKKMFDALRPGGVIVTYAARGVIKRSMIEVGFSVEKLAGAPGKREMLRATKRLF